MKIGDILIDGRVVGEIQLAMREEGEPSLVMPDYGAQDLIPEPSDESGDRGDYPYGGHAPGGPSEPGGPSAPVSPGTSHAPRKPGPTFRPGIGPGSQRREDRKVRTARDGPTFRRGIGPGPRHLKARQTDIHRGSGSGGNINRETRGQLTGITAEEAGVKPDFPVKSGVDWRHMDAEYVRRANKAWQMASPAERAGSYLNSGYRSTEHQARIYRSGVRPAAPPGRSMHQFGGAGDWVNDRFLQRYGAEVGLRSGRSFNDPHHWQLSEPRGNYPTTDRSMAGRIHGQYPDLDDERRTGRHMPAPGPQPPSPPSSQAPSADQPSPQQPIAERRAERTPADQPRVDEPPAPPRTPGVAAPPALENLHSQRTRFADELRDSTTHERLLRLTQAENPQNPQAFMESVMNRAAARQQTLTEAMNDRHYYPRVSLVGRTPQDRATMEAALNRVLGGSNMIHYATGNASLNVGFGYGHGARDPFTYRDPVTHERYGIENRKSDIRWAAHQNDQEQLAGQASARARTPHVDIGPVTEVSRQPPPSLGPSGGFRPSTVNIDNNIDNDLNRAIDQISKENK